MAFAGPTYLITGGELPFTAESVREQLGLLDPMFDKLIETVIFSQCSKHGAGMNSAVWAVARGDDLGGFFKAANKNGRLVKIGPAYSRNGTTYHDCEYAADPVKVAKAFRAVCNWCWDDLHISKAIIRERQGHFRTVWPDRRPQPVPSPYAVAAE